MAHVGNSRSPSRSGRPGKSENPEAERHMLRRKARGSRPPAHVRKGSQSEPRIPCQQRATETVEAIVTAAARILVEQG
jgi:hypothetical protein